MNGFSDIGSVDQAALQLRANIPVRERQYPLFGDDHDVLRGWKPGFVQSEKLAQNALNPVSLDGIPRFFADRHAQSSDSRMVRKCEDVETLRGYPHPLLIDPQIILPFPYTLISAKGLGFHAVSRPFPGASPKRPWPARGGYTASLFLPFARLRLSTALPPRVAIRTRKPWVRFRLVLLNVVNVFFIV
jgi:hypothetical protein